MCFYNKMQFNKNLNKISSSSLTINYKTFFLLLFIKPENNYKICLLFGTTCYYLRVLFTRTFFAVFSKSK